MNLVTILGWIFTGLGFAGAGYAVLAAVFVRRFAAQGEGRAETCPPLSILKPLHGDEPALAANLESFLVQDYPAPVQIVFGVQTPDDSAIGVVEGLRARHPGADIALVIDPARHGANPKVANLINMSAAVRHDTIILADSDIAVEPDYLRRIAAALAPERVGAVTCIYTGWAAAARVTMLQSPPLPSATPRWRPHGANGFPTNCAGCGRFGRWIRPVMPGPW